MIPHALRHWASHYYTYKYNSCTCNYMYLSRRYFCLYTYFVCQLQTGDLPAICAIAGGGNNQTREIKVPPMLRRMVPYINIHMFVSTLTRLLTNCGMI